MRRRRFRTLSEYHRLDRCTRSINRKREQDDLPFCPAKKISIVPRTRPKSKRSVSRPVNYDENIYGVPVTAIQDSDLVNARRYIADHAREFFDSSPALNTLQVSTRGEQFLDACNLPNHAREILGDPAILEKLVKMDSTMREEFLEALYDGSVCKSNNESVAVLREALQLNNFVELLDESEDDGAVHDALEYDILNESDDEEQAEQFLLVDETLSPEVCPICEIESRLNVNMFEMGCCSGTHKICSLCYARCRRERQKLCPFCRAPCTFSATTETQIIERISREADLLAENWPHASNRHEITCIQKATSRLLLNKKKSQKNKK